MKRFSALAAITLVAPFTQALALPIDWHGKFTLNSTYMDNYRKIGGGNNAPFSTTSGAADTNPGSQEVSLPSGGKTSASFQAYSFALTPTIIVNDASTLKATFSKDNGLLGESPRTTPNNMGSALYAQSHSNTTTIGLSELYLTLYSDTATYLLGRHTAHFGLGAITNSGQTPLDHSKSTRDGVTANFQIGSFKLSPFYSKSDLGGSLAGASATKEYGFSLLYDNADREMVLGLLYQKKKTSANSQTTTQDINHDGTFETNADASITITDLYFKKVIGKFDLSLEVPLLSGEISSTQKYAGKGFIFEGNYNLNNNWKLGVDAGKISGDGGAGASFDALYLNPNYQVANILFRYNTMAVANPSDHNLYDSYITNANYLKLRGDYRSDKWLWKGAYIYAVANETATAGKVSYNHMVNKRFTATQTQESGMGSEIDLGCNYFWNSETTLTADIGYLISGPYFEFTNTANSNNAANVLLMQAGISLAF